MPPFPVILFLTVPLGEIKLNFEIAFSKPLYFAFTLVNSAMAGAPGVLLRISDMSGTERYNIIALTLINDEYIFFGFRRKKLVIAGLSGFIVLAAYAKYRKRSRSQLYASHLHSHVGSNVPAGLI